jgi:hypothetical protein
MKMSAMRNKTPVIGELGWRPTEVHPLAALFPPLSDDDLAALAADIKANGLIRAITIDDAGTLIDGRMRLDACDKAGVEPRFERLNGHDVEAFIWGVNAQRRDMTKGQKAMVAAMSLSLEPNKSSGGRPDTGVTRAARAAGVSQPHLSQALTVKQFASHLVPQVIGGGLGFHLAYQQAQANKQAIEWQEDGLRKLREVAPDLAARVTEGEINVEDARKAHEERLRAEEAMRDSVLLGISNFTRSASGFERSEALTRLPEWVAEGGPALDHVRRYFKGGVKEVAELLDAAQRGIDAVRSIIDSIPETTTRKGRK